MAPASLHLDLSLNCLETAWLKKLGAREALGARPLDLPVRFLHVKTSVSNNGSRIMVMGTKDPELVVQHRDLNSRADSVDEDPRVFLTAMNWTPEDTILNSFRNEQAQKLFLCVFLSTMLKTENAHETISHCISTTVFVLLFGESVSLSFLTSMQKSF